MALRMPAEHGAWGILAVPFVCAAAVGGAWNLPLLLAAVCTVSLFLLRGSVEAQGGWRSRAIFQRPHLVLAFSGATTAGLLIIAFHRYQLALAALFGGALYLLQQRVAQPSREPRREKRSLAAELTGVLLLTLGAPCAWIAARGRLDASGALLWLLNVLFFLGGVLYVKYRIRGIAAHRRFAGFGEKLAFVWPVALYHLLVLAFLACWVLIQSFPVALLVAFVPATFRASALLFHLGQRFPIRRLGWTEVVHSLVFAALLIGAFRA